MELIKSLFSAIKSYGGYEIGYVLIKETRNRKVKKSILSASCISVVDEHSEDGFET